jgi:hypothetical protein
VRRRRTDNRLVGDTVAYLMRNAPGEVLLNLVPPDYPMQGSAAEYDAWQAAPSGADPQAIDRRE